MRHDFWYASRNCCWSCAELTRKKNWQLVSIIQHEIDVRMEMEIMLDLRKDSWPIVSWSLLFTQGFREEWCEGYNETGMCEERDSKKENKENDADGLDRLKRASSSILALFECNFRYVENLVCKSSENLVCGSSENLVCGWSENLVWIEWEFCHARKKVGLIHLTSKTMSTSMIKS